VSTVKHSFGDGNQAYYMRRTIAIVTTTTLPKANQNAREHCDSNAMLR